MDENELHELTKQIMLDGRMIPTTMSIKDAFIIASALELAADHPGLGVPLAGYINRIARKIRRAVTERHPDAQRGAKKAVLEKAMRDECDLQMYISIGQAWALVGGLQLAARHPQITPSLFGILTQYGRLFQGSVVEMWPEAAEVIERGWNPEFDVKG